MFGRHVRFVRSKGRTRICVECLELCQRALKTDKQQKRHPHCVPNRTQMRTAWSVPVAINYKPPLSHQRSPSVHHGPLSPHTTTDPTNTQKKNTLTQTVRWCTGATCPAHRVSRCCRQRKKIPAVLSIRPVRRRPARGRRWSLVVPPRQRQCACTARRRRRRPDGSRRQRRRQQRWRQRHRRPHQRQRQRH